MTSRGKWFVAGCAVATVALILWTRSADAPAPRLEQELEQIVAQTVAGNPSVKNCVLAVMTGDGSFSWPAPRAWRAKAMQRR